MACLNITENDQRPVQQERQTTTRRRIENVSSNTRIDISILQLDSNIHAAQLQQSRIKYVAGDIHTTTAKEEIQQQMKRSSFWVTEAQPSSAATTNTNRMILDSTITNKNRNSTTVCLEDESIPHPPPNRPLSPMSGQPLQLKDLIPLQFQREKKDKEEDGQDSSIRKKNTDTNGQGVEGRGTTDHGRVLCAISGKVITTQPVIAIKPSGIVLLKQVYESIVQPTMIFPITGRKLHIQDILELQCGKSGYAASSGSVSAKTYRPTLT